jgi:hypothetical protein
MRVEGSVTTVSWIPSEAVTGAVFRVPFQIGMAHYDDPPPDQIGDVAAYLATDRARFANQLQAWIEVRDGHVVGYGHEGEGRIGSTTLRMGRFDATFAAVALPTRQSAEPLDDGSGPTAVRFEQTAGGRTGAPAPRRVSRPPYVQLAAPLAWTTLRLTLHADGRQEHELVGASPFPRHWVYDADGALAHKSAIIDYQQWSTNMFGQHSPWGNADAPVPVAEAESALERQLSLAIMRSGERPRQRKLAVGEHLTEQGQQADEIFLLLDGLLQVDVDGTVVSEVGPGAVLGERAVLERGRRTATLKALTPCRVAVAERSAVDEDALRQLATGHHREAGAS